jgi:SRSO17 transposase
MDYVLDLAAQRRLGEYFSEIGSILNNVKRRASFATYAMGLLGDGERKSVEPISARACADDKRIEAHHQRLLHFLTDSEWSDREVRRCAARYATTAMVERDPILAWIVDDTGFIKQGSHSVGVQRQYTGSAGKITNCQIGVSLSITTRTEHVPVDFELYLPESWANDPARRIEARIPDDVVFKTKIELAKDMIDRACADELPKGVVLADTFYGTSADFREHVRCHGLDYAVAINERSTVWRLDTLGRRSGDPISASDLARELPIKSFRRITWRAGTKKKLSARFAIERVVLVGDDGWEPAEREAVWLVIEWLDGEDAPTKFHVTTLPPTCTKKRLVRVIKERYRTERVYEDLKGELGLDHFEGRRFRGWHHHVTVALCCYAFVVAERVRRFSPSQGRSDQTDPNPLAA